jgi:HEAT repeat protein
MSLNGIVGSPSSRATRPCAMALVALSMSFLAGARAGGEDPDVKALRERIEALEAKLDRVLKALAALGGPGAGGAAPPEDFQYKRRPLADWIVDLGDREMETALWAVHAIAGIGTEALPRLEEPLRSKDAVVRKNAVRSVSFMKDLGGCAGVTVLIDMLRDPDANVRDEASNALRSKPTPGGIPALIAALKNQREGTRATAAIALGSQRDIAVASGGNPPWGLSVQTSEEMRKELRKVLPGAVPALVESLRDPAADVRVAAAQTLMRFGSDAASAIPTLTDLLQDQPKVRDAAIASALVIGPGDLAGRFVPPLVARLKEEDPSRRADAADSLAKLGPAARDAVPALEEALKGTTQAAEGEETPGDGSSSKAQPKEPPLIFKLARAIALLRPEAPVGAAVPTARLVEILREGLASGDSFLRLEAAKALAALGPAAGEAIPDLEEMTSGSSGAKKMTPRSTLRSPTFRKSSSLSDRDREALEEALKRIRGEISDRDRKALEEALKRIPGSDTK